MERLIMAASNISVSELKSNRKYMSVSMRMFSTRANLNKCAVTEAFIDEIIANKSDYICMPLCADVSKLKRKDYRGLTHLQDRTTGTFLADEIGSFYDYEKVSDEFGVSLIGYARINKRSKLVSEAIQELYDNNALNFSFEISAGAVNVVDGISIVDANEENELTAMAVVSVPAYPESKALELVAEADDVNRFFANADVQISEVDIETVRRRFHELLYAIYDYRVYSMRVFLFCHDCVLLYDEENGKTIKVEYMMENDDIIIKDCYEVEYVRSEGSEKEMIDEKNTFEAEAAVEVAEEIAEVEVQEEVAVAETEVAEAETEVETAEEQTEEVAAEVEVAEEDKDEDEKNDPEDDLDDKNEKDEMAELREQCAQLEDEIETLKQYKAELDKIEEEKLKAEADAKKENLRSYAAGEGLSVEEKAIAEAIDALNYEAIFAEVTAHKNKAKEKKVEGAYFASFTEMSVKGDYSYLFGSR